MFEIEKNVPPPRNTAGVPAKYPWREMEIGDSFFVPENKAPKKMQTYRMGKELGRKFSYASVEGGIRVWRIA